MDIPQECILKQIAIGPMGNFCYFIGDVKENKIAIVDPGWDDDELMDMVNKEKYQVAAILLTHGHYDHANEAERLAQHWSVPIYVSEREEVSLRSNPIVKVKDLEDIQIGELNIKCFLTPGHTSGSQCFKYKNILLTGDTLFVNACGRCDLPTGNAQEMHHSLYDIILSFPDETLIFPGHAYGSKSFATIAQQKRSNPYLKYKSEKEFMDIFME